MAGNQGVPSLMAGRSCRMPGLNSGSLMCGPSAPLPLTAEHLQYMASFAGTCCLALSAARLKVIHGGALRMGLLAGGLSHCSGGQSKRRCRLALSRPYSRQEAQQESFEAVAASNLRGHHCRAAVACTASIA